MRRFLTVLLLAASPLSFASVAAAESETTAPRLLEVPRLDFTKRVLANGATLYAIRDTGTATVSINIWYDVGQRDDPPGRGGFAHLFEHLMFKTTRNLPGGVLEAVNAMGGNSNASTLFDYTDYYITAPANQLEGMLWLEGERMRNLVIDEKSFHSERDVVKEELRQRILSKPYGRILYMLLPAFTFDGHPYARPIGGTIADLDQAKLADVQAFHEAYYRPDNAVFVVSGNFDPAKLDVWADRYLGSIPRPDRAIPRDPAKGRPVVARTIDAYAPNVPLPAVAFAWRAPFAADADAAGIDLIEAVLTRGAASRLRRYLVDEKGVASEITSYNLPARDGHAFALVVTLAEGREIADADAALGAEIARLRDTPLAAEELDAVKNGLFGDALARRETARGRAYELGGGAALTSDPGLADARLDAIRRMTPAAVQRVAKKWLDDGKRVTLRYRDESQRPPGYAGDASPDVSKMGPTIPPASQPPVAIASEGAREARPEPAEAVPSALPTLAERRLTNGLRVVVAQSSKVPLASVRLVIDGGDAADPAGQAGRGDIAAALALKGAGGRSAERIASEIAALGGTIGAGSDADATVFSVNAPTANIEAAARILADVATRPDFAADALDGVRSQQLSAIAVATKQPMQTALRALPAALFGKAPYGAVPTATSLGAVTQDDVAAAQRETWIPNAATLIVTGALTPDAAFALAERSFGSWKAGKAPTATPRGTVSTSPHVVAVDMPGVAQAAVIVALPTAGRRDADWPSLRIANAALGGGFQGWLTQEIRVKRGLTYGAGSLLDSRRDAAYLMAVTQTKTASANEVVGLILDQIGRFGREPVDAGRAGERATYLANGLSGQNERAAGLADYLVTLISSGAALDTLAAERSPLAPSPERIAAAIEAHLRADQATIVVAGDSKQWVGALRERFPTLELVDIDGKSLP
ncbi:insulinase family protein [Sphingopyxis sp. PAMC25046]|uniref:M16 family metallopeptidase n=1 Tax=Sphingopyxis sp. PAMC25046 TaxID=2565556 RepID=UPI00109DCE27|nr:pitrilysin family protein [Sphingopyxis sp. PAMC25046]QCB55625.1 insulinase family protein [Sphingopyxis sp. PAMC25046]